MSFLMIPWTSSKHTRSWMRPCLLSSTGRGSWGRWSGGYEANCPKWSFPSTSYAPLSGSCLEMPQTSSLTTHTESAMRCWWVGGMPPNPHNQPHPQWEEFRYFRANWTLTAIRGNKDISFLVSPSVQSVQKYGSGERESISRCRYLFGWIWLQNELQIPSKHCAWVVDGQMAHGQKEDLHKYTSMKVHTSAFVIWSGGQQKQGSWSEICESTKNSSLYIFRAYFQTIQQAFPRTILLWQTSNKMLINFITILNLCLYWEIVKYYNGSCP